MRKDLGAKPYLVPQPVLIVAAYDEEGKANCMNVQHIQGAEAAVVPGALIFFSGISQTYDQPVFAIFAKHSINSQSCAYLTIL